MNSGDTFPGAQVQLNYCFWFAFLTTQLDCRVASLFAMMRIRHSICCNPNQKGRQKRPFVTLHQAAFVRLLDLGFFELDMLAHDGVVFAEGHFFRAIAREKLVEKWHRE
jgi:hypothetical protein